MILMIVVGILSLQAAFAKTSEENQQQTILIETLQTTSRSQRETIEECEGKLREQETLRRKLHNTIQELKGNIRVFCTGVRKICGQIISLSYIPNSNSKTCLARRLPPFLHVYTLRLIWQVYVLDAC